MTKAVNMKPSFRRLTKKNDLALLKVEFGPQIVMQLGKPKLGQDIYVVGFPFELNFSDSVKVTKGIVSSLTGDGNNLAQI